MDRCTCDKFITKFTNKDNKFYIKLLWKPNEDDLFHITVFDGESSWSGKFSNNYAEKFREHLQKNHEEYCLDIKRCLKEQDSDYIYEFLKVEDENDSATFKWSKPYKDVKVTFGSIPLKRDIQTEDSLIDFLIFENKNLNNTIKTYYQKAEEMKSDLKKYRQEMEKFVNLKISLENDLYGKFMQLLCEKKRRIILLEETLQKASLM